MARVTDVAENPCLLFLGLSKSQDIAVCVFVFVFMSEESVCSGFESHKVLMEDNNSLYVAVK